MTHRGWREIHERLRAAYPGVDHLTLWYPIPLSAAPAELAARATDVAMVERFAATHGLVLKEHHTDERDYRNFALRIPARTANTILHTLLHGRLLRSGQVLDAPAGTTTDLDLSLVQMLHVSEDA